MAATQAVGWMDGSVAVGQKRCQLRAWPGLLCGRAGGQPDTAPLCQGEMDGEMFLRRLGSLFAPPQPSSL